MLLIKIFFTLLMSVTTAEYDFHLSLEYFEAPVFHCERSVKIFRKGEKITIKSENYSGRDFEKDFETDDYIALIDSLNKAGIWSVKSDTGGDRIKNNYYFLTIKTPTKINLIRYETHSSLNNGTSPMPLIIRTIENYVYLYNPDNI
ncbi:MAG: hypothetical protein JW982_00910 [Spirochaetes bacterium]|nr:hypothetical protein [Spirochaetota bacterium]